MSGRQHCGAPTTVLRRVIPAGSQAVVYFNNGVLTFVNGVWAWRSNPGQELLQYRDGSWAEVSQADVKPYSDLI